MPGVNDVDLVVLEECAQRLALDPVGQGAKAAAPQDRELGEQTRSFRLPRDAALRRVRRQAQATQDEEQGYQTESERRTRGVARRHAHDVVSRSLRTAVHLMVDGGRAAERAPHPDS